MKLIIGNWKMNYTETQSLDCVNDLISSLNIDTTNNKVVICPPFTSLSCVGKVLKGASLKGDSLKRASVFLGAQNVSEAYEGAYTGEVSIGMLSDLGVSYVIIGHAERRMHNHETDVVIKEKVKIVCKSKTNAVLCIGESHIQRKNNEWRGFLKNQLSVLSDLDIVDADYLSIAYEPLWAIGTGETPTEHDIMETHQLIKDQLEAYFFEKGKEIPVLYGGSVNERNACSILNLKGVDGVLVGGASLKKGTFLPIIHFDKYV